MLQAAGTVGLRASNCHKKWGCTFQSAEVSILVQMIWAKIVSFILWIDEAARVPPKVSQIALVHPLVNRTSNLDHGFKCYLSLHTLVLYHVCSFISGKVNLSNGTTCSLALAFHPQALRRSALQCPTLWDWENTVRRAPNLHPFGSFWILGLSCSWTSDLRYLRDLFWVSGKVKPLMRLHPLVNLRYFRFFGMWTGH